MAKNTQPEWAKEILGAVVSLEDGEVVIRFSASDVVAEGPSTDKAGKEQDPTLYFLRTTATRGLAIPELAVNGVVPLVSINGWYPKSPKATPRQGKLYATAIKASERLAQLLEERKDRK